MTRETAMWISFLMCGPTHIIYVRFTCLAPPRASKVGGDLAVSDTNWAGRDL